jgi:hypothetical protein
MDNLIIGGDLNFTIRNEHIWGSLACEDKLAHFFTNKFERNDLIDVEPIKICPTWSKNRSEKEGITKILDRLLAHLSTLEAVGLYQ